MSVKDIIGTWQNNAYVYKSPHAYKTVKNFLGGEFHVFLNSLGLNDTEKNSVPPVSCLFKNIFKFLYEHNKINIFREHMSSKIMIYQDIHQIQICQNKFSMELINIILTIRKKMVMLLHVICLSLM